MASYFFEPFYSLNDFDRLFDEAFALRTGGQPQGSNNSQGQGQVQRRQGTEPSSRVLRPR